MKQKLSFKSIIIAFIGMLMLSCQYDIDEYQENNQHQEKLGYKATKITLNDVKDNPVAFSKLTNPVKNKSLSKLNHRIINDSINNFSIDTEIGTFIEMENYHSYTFKVIRPNGSNYLLENLVVSKDGTNEYETYLYLYDITPQELQMVKEGANINLSNKISRILIENSNIVTDINAKEFPCFVQVTTYIPSQNCTGADHHAFGDITCPLFLNGLPGQAQAGYYITESVLSTCNDSSGGGGNEEDTSDPTQTTGSGGGSTTVTTPTTCTRNCPELYEEEDLITSEELCNDLASKDLNLDFNAKMADLKNRAATQEFESAYAMYQNAGSGLNFSPRFDGTTQDKSVLLERPSMLTTSPTNCIGFIHCHLDDGSTFLVFSFTDLTALAHVVNDSTRPTSEYGVYVTTASGTFCLKVKNRIKFKNTLGWLMVNKLKYENEFSKFVKINDPLNKQTLGLLKFMKENDFNTMLDLYKKNETTNEWELLELNSNSTDLVKTNCN